MSFILRCLGNLNLVGCHEIGNLVSQLLDQVVGAAEKEDNH